MKRKIVSVLVIVGITLLGSGVPAYSAVPYSSAALQSRLKYMVEEEKLARDVYTVLAKTAVYPKFIQSSFNIYLVLIQRLFSVPLVFMNHCWTAD